MNIPTTPRQEGPDDPLPGLQQSRDGAEEGQNQIAEATQECEGTTYQSDISDRPESEVQRWIYSATSTEQRRKRFYAVLHSTYPSNYEFNAMRHPFYDPEEDGPYDEFIKNEMWDGPCPWNDDDYDPRTDPARSTKVWQPKIGDEGIENEEDRRMVLRARKEHKARSRRFRKCRILFIKSQMDAGVEFANMDTAQVLVGPGIRVEYSDSSDDDDDDDDDDGEEVVKEVVEEVVEEVVGEVVREVVREVAEEVVEGPKPAFKTEAQSLTTISQAVETTVVDAQETGSPCRQPQGRPRGSKNKKRRMSYKRKRGPKKENPNGTYHYEADSEEERPAHKKGRKADWATGGTDAGNEPRRVQTRSTTRRNASMGMDGSCDDGLNDDGESSIVTSSDTDYQSKSSDNTAESITESHSIKKNKDTFRTSRPEIPFWIQQTRNELSPGPEGAELRPEIVMSDIGDLRV
ncbi:hypothetical protein GGR51DRAFT_569930 [Nemania sp. FL0031]|nr:hypothetical protein GGR51DRAFT_569930 [Nemania sp. FL0031]